MNKFHPVTWSFFPDFYKRKGRLLLNNVLNVFEPSASGIKEWVFAHCEKKLSKYTDPVDRQM